MPKKSRLTSEEKKVLETIELAIENQGMQESPFNTLANLEASKLDIYLKAHPEKIEFKDFVGEPPISYLTKSAKHIEIYLKHVPKNKQKKILNTETLNLGLPINVAATFGNDPTIFQAMEANGANIFQKDKFGIGAAGHLFFSQNDDTHRTDQRDYSPLAKYLVEKGFDVSEGKNEAIKLQQIKHLRDKILDLKVPGLMDQVAKSIKDNPKPDFNEVINTLEIADDKKTQLSDHMVKFEPNFNPVQKELIEKMEYLQDHLQYGVDLKKEFTGKDKSKHNDQDKMDAVIRNHKEQSLNSLLYDHPIQLISNDLHPEVARDGLKEFRNFLEEDIGKCNLASRNTLHFCQDKPWLIDKLSTNPKFKEAVEQKDINGQTPLSNAVSVASLNGFTTFLKYGADIHTTDNYGANLMTQLFEQLGNNSAQGRDSAKLIQMGEILIKRGFDAGKIEEDYVNYKKLRDFEKQLENYAEKFNIEKESLQLIVDAAKNEKNPNITQLITKSDLISENKLDLIKEMNNVKDKLNEPQKELVEKLKALQKTNMIKEFVDLRKTQKDLDSRLAKKFPNTFSVSPQVSEAPKKEKGFVTFLKKLVPSFVKDLFGSKKDKSMAISEMGNQPVTPLPNLEAAKKSSQSNLRGAFKNSPTQQVAGKSLDHAPNQTPTKNKTLRKLGEQFCKIFP